jgi:hypothetical protein
VRNSTAHSSAASKVRAAYMWRSSTSRNYLPTCRLRPPPNLRPTARQLEDPPRKVSRRIPGYQRNDRIAPGVQIPYTSFRMF